jgi:YegS/Rv2252/BmrU family lipid kinase
MEPVPGRILIIANPISGRGKSSRRAARIARLLQERGCTVDLRSTVRAGDAVRLAGDAAGCAAVVAVGGDGTINEVLNGLPTHAPPLGIVPTGTANVMAKELGLPRRLGALAQVIARGHHTFWDLGINRTTGRKFLLFASAGFDAAIVRRFLSERGGTIRMSDYIAWGLRSLPDFEAPVIRVEVDGRLIEPRASWVEVANVAAYGGPLVLAPQALPTDGLFDVMIQTAHRRRDAMRLMFAGLWRYGLRRPYPMRDLRLVRGRHVRLGAEGEPALQLDGDPAGALPATFELIPRAVRVLTRRSGPVGSTP